MGIIFMSISLLLLIGIVVLVFYIKKKVTDIHNNIEGKLEDINDMAIRPAKKVFDIASSFVSGFSKSRKKNRKK